MHQIPLRYAHVVEKRLAERRLPVDQLDRFHCYTRIVHREQQKADAVVLRRVRVGAHQAEDPVGVIGAGCPDLAAVHQVVVAFVFRPGFQAGEVGTGSRLAVTLAPRNVATGDFRQMTQLLIFGAVFQQRRADHRYAHSTEWGTRVDALQFLEQHEKLVLLQTSPAIRHRPGRHGPALLRHPFEPRVRVGIGAAPLVTTAHLLPGLHASAHRGRAVFLQPGPGFPTEFADFRHAVGARSW